jgi:hypothetical protein
MSNVTMTEERTAASAFGALALGGFQGAYTAPTMSVCALAIRVAHKDWDVRPLIPDGGGGG